MKRFLPIFTALALPLSLVFGPVSVKADADYNTLAPMLDADANSDGEYTGNEVYNWFSGLAETAQETFANTAGTFLDLCNGVASTVEHTAQTVGDYFQAVGDLPIFHALDNAIDLDVDALNTYNTTVLQNIYSDSSGLVCYVGSSDNVANYYAPTNTPNLPSAPANYIGGSSYDGRTWFSLYTITSNSPYLSSENRGVRDMRFMVYGGMFSNATEYYVTFVCYSFNGSMFVTYGNFKCWVTLDNFVGAPVFTSLAKGQNYYLGVSDMYGFPSAPSSNLSVSPSVFHQNINEVANTFYNEYKDNIVNTDLSINEIDSLLKVAINTYFATEHEIEPTELIDYVRAIYLILKEQKEQEDAESQAQDTPTISIDESAFDIGEVYANMGAPGSYPNLIYMDVSIDDEGNTGSDKDTAFWVTFGKSDIFYYFLALPIMCAVSAYIIFGRRG